MEHFAILIGAGANDCPFRIAMDEYITKIKDIKDEQDRYQKKSEENPMTPEDDIHNLYYWVCDSYHCLRPYLRTTEWNVTLLHFQLHLFVLYRAEVLTLCHVPPPKNKMSGDPAPVFGTTGHCALSHDKLVSPGLKTRIKENCNPVKIKYTIAQKV